MSSNTSTSIGGTNYYYETSGAADAIVQKAGETLQFTVHPGDVWASDPRTFNRSEIASSMQIANGTPVHVAYQMTIQNGAVDPNPSGWAVLGQFHQNDSPSTPRNSPPFSVAVVAGKMQIAIGYSDAVTKDTSRVIWTDPKPIVQGATYAMDIIATFDPSGNGHLKVSRNGVQLVDYAGPLGYNSQQSVYWKEGIYRGATTSTMVTSYAKLAVATGASPAAKPRASAAISSTPGAFHVSSKTSDYDASTGKGTSGTMRYVSADASQTLEKRFNASGTLVYQQQKGLNGSQTTTTYGSNGVLQQSMAIHADKSSDSAQYGITNQTYVSLLTHKDSQGTITWQQEGFANGGKSTTAYGTAAQNFKTKTCLFNASGIRISATYLYRDGSSGVYNYAAGGAVTQAMVTAKDGTQTTTTYASNGVIQQSKTVHTDGSRDYTSYNAAGVKTTTFFSHTDGSSETDVFAGNGKLIQRFVKTKDGTQTTSTYASNGVIQQSKIAYASGEKDYTSYNAAGVKTSTFVSHTDGSSEVDAFASNGTLTQKIVTAKDGTQTTNRYSLNGSLEEMKLIHTDGSGVYTDYNVGGHLSILTKVNTAGATTAVQQVDANGSATGRAYAAGVTLVSQNGSDSFTSYHNDTFVFHQGFGHDTITGFNGAGSLHDVLQIDKSLVADFAHLSMTQSGANSVITVSPHDSITLKGVKVSALSSSSFTFV